MEALPSEEVPGARGRHRAHLARTRHADSALKMNKEEVLAANYRIRMSSLQVASLFPDGAARTVHPGSRSHQLRRRDRHHHADQRSGGYRRHHYDSGSPNVTPIDAVRTYVPPMPSSVSVAFGAGSVRRTCPAPLSDRLASLDTRRLIDRAGLAAQLPSAALGRRDQPIRGHGH